MLKPLKSAAGFLSVDFLFGFFLVFMFVMVFFVLSFSVVAFQIGQYVCFSSARAYFAAGESQEAQKNAAREKFRALMRSRALRGMFHAEKDWFVAGPVEIGVDQSQAFNESNPSHLFYGVGFKLNAKALGVRIPGYGGEVEPAQNSKEGFVVRIFAFLSREVSKEECTKFNAARWSRVINFSEFQALQSFLPSQLPADQVASWGDNGC